MAPVVPRSKINAGRSSRQDNWTRPTKSKPQPAVWFPPVQQSPFALNELHVAGMQTL